MMCQAQRMLSFNIHLIFITTLFADMENEKQKDYVIWPRTHRKKLNPDSNPGRLAPVSKCLLGRFSIIKGSGKAAYSLSPYGHLGLSDLLS